MPIRFHSFAIALLSLAVFFASCSKKSSSDNPLTITYNPSIIIGGDNHVVYALDPLTGLKNWEFGCAAKIISSPLIYNEMLYIGTDGSATGDTLYKINVQTGALVKAIVANGANYNIIATPTADANLIYLACTNNTLYAIDTGNYTVKWAFVTSGPIQSSPVVFNGFVYFGCSDGNVYCVDKTLGASGTHNWTWNPYTSGITTHSINWTSSPAIGISKASNVTDTVLCIGGSDSSMYCLQLFAATYSNSFKWFYKTGGIITSSPTIYGGACVFGSQDFYIYCVDISTNAVRWPPLKTNSNISSSPYTKNSVIYIGSNDYNLYAVDFHSGGIKWRFATSGLIKSSPLAYGPYVYIGSYDKNFYAVDTITGTLKWQFAVNNSIECSPAVDNNTGASFNSSISGLTN